MDISTDPEAREYVMALGYLQAPVVYVGPDNHFCGFRPDRIKALVNPTADHYDLEEPAMHQLTIATDTATSTTGHDDFADAHRALMSHVIAQDLYLHASWPTPRTAVTFKLVSLGPADREPHITGTATIEPAPAKPVMGPYYSAEAALRWTAEHTATWRHGCDTDPGVRYPLAVLTAARAEARYWFTAGTIYNEAAELSDVGIVDVPRPRQNTFEILRESAITAGRNASITTAAELADAVQARLTADITAQQTAALIWYYALILWGVNAP